MPKGGKHKGKSTLHKRKASQPPTQPRRKQPARGAKFRNNNNNLGGWGWGGGPSGNAAKIEEYMTSHGVVRKSIIGDGNCLFRAMADQIGYGEGRHREIRDRIVQTIKADREYFANFIDEEAVGGVDEYCDEMIKNGMSLLIFLISRVDS
jgi:OTU-like cysteine protease